MSSLDGASRLWLAQLAFTMASIAVLLLRRPCRRWLGPERAFQLWLLPPLAMIVSQFPHAAPATPAAQTLVYAIATAGGTLPMAQKAEVVDGHWHVLLIVWGMGGAIVAAGGWLAQQRYRRRLNGAQPWHGAFSRCPIVISADLASGPALVGAWRPCIILPSDFSSRYEPHEQELILAHEQTHADRHDGLWSLCAFALVALCWPHTLAWWCLRLFRQDQELACDAAVMRTHYGRRRLYAEAMLKAQRTGGPLPAGCAWSPRHPLTERIAMLKVPPHSIRRRRLGAGIVAAFAAVTVSAVYAATPTAAAHVAGATDRYALQVDIGYDGATASMHMRQCLKAGEFFSISGSADDVPGWHGRFVVLPASDGLLEVRADVDGGPLDKPIRPRVRAKPGETATVEIGEVNHADPGASRGIRIDLTPHQGC